MCRILPTLLLALTLPVFTGLLLSASAVQRLGTPPVLPIALPGCFGGADRFNPLVKRLAKLEVEGWLRALLLAVLDLLLLTEVDGAPKAEVVLLAVLAA